MAIFLLGNKKYSWIGLPFAVIMGLTRIYLIVHYATDVIVAWMMGALAGVIAFYLVKWIEKKWWHKKTKSKSNE